MSALVSVTINAGSFVLQCPEPFATRWKVVAALDALEVHYEEPVEKLWKKSKQHDTHLHYLPTFDALTEKVEQALLKFANIPEEILALCSLPTELAEAA
jgi:hypothetical protein